MAQRDDDQHLGQEPEEAHHQPEHAGHRTESEERLDGMATGSCGWLRRTSPVMGERSYFRRLRAITMRCTWLVPS